MPEGYDILRPPALRPGDEVLLVSPAGPVDRDRVARRVQLLTGWGLRVRVAPHALDRIGFLAGSDTDRLADLNAGLSDPAVRGLLCTRGGYGVQRIVDGLDLAAVRADPKVVAGFSDITALQLALWRGARLATVHGPGARAVLMTAEPVVVKRDPAGETAAVSAPGTASGILLGGNLSLLTATVGTRDLPDLTGAILLLEDVNEAPYRVDRMLTQLRRGGLLDRVAGVALGQFTRCLDDRPVSIVDVLVDRLCDLGVPVLGGLPIGHGDQQSTVPVGVPATLDVAAGTLTAEPAVRQPPAGV